MGKTGPKPQGLVKIKWSAGFAYALGLIASDGNLSSDGRHITLVSTDKDQLETFCRVLGVGHKITSHTAQDETYKRKSSFRVQIGDVLFYAFLQKIGFTPNKSRTIGAIGIPRKYFFDFLRGSFDGDGCSYSYWDKRWKSSFMFYVVFCSASEKHTTWIRTEISERLGINGHISRTGVMHQLRYAKSDSAQLLKRLYPTRDVPCLRRKRLKIEATLAIIGKRLPE